MKNPHVIHAVAALVFSPAGLAAAGAQHQHPAAPFTRAHPYDLQFIDMMLHHHQDGIRMSEIEQKEGDRDAVKAFEGAAVDREARESRRQDR